MNSTGHEPAVSPELVVMAAGVVTASDELAMDTIRDLTPIRLSPARTNFSDPALSYVPACRETTEAKQ